jgi:hypothetical protein
LTWSSTRSPFFFASNKIAFNCSLH